MSQEKRKASMCRNFMEFSEYQIRENPNLTFGNGKCPEVAHVIDGDYDCPKDCKSYRELK